MWKYNDKTIKVGKSWKTSDGITHPTNWNNWSDEDKVTNGLVWEDDPAPVDDRFYWSADNPKSLDDVTETIHGKEFVTIGLKSEAKLTTKQQAANLLANTDWYIVRKAEDATSTIPTDVTTYRAAVRTASGNIETAIDNASDLDAFIALHNTPVDSDNNSIGNPPINNWPNEPNTE